MIERNRWKSTLIVLALIAMSGCASLQSAKHKYVMRGQILEVSGERGYVCVGSADGARAGQMVEVQHFVRQAFSPKEPAYYRRDVTGMAEITEVVDEHFAWIKLNSGTMQPNDQIELRR